MVKIGAELPKLSQKQNWVSVFWNTLYVSDVIHKNLKLKCFVVASQKPL